MVLPLPLPLVVVAVVSGEVPLSSSSSFFSTIVDAHARTNHGHKGVV